MAKAVLQFHLLLPFLPIKEVFYLTISDGNLEFPTSSNSCLIIGMKHAYKCSLHCGVHLQPCMGVAHYGLHMAQISSWLDNLMFLYYGQNESIHFTRPHFVDNPIRVILHHCSLYWASVLPYCDCRWAVQCSGHCTILMCMWTTPMIPHLGVILYSFVWWKNSLRSVL